MMSGSGEITVFANATIDGATEMVLHSPRAAGEGTVSILFGRERLSLEFYDVASLERLRDLADEGVRRLLS
jgi:hypothetical protein